MNRAISIAIVLVMIPFSGHARDIRKNANDGEGAMIQDCRNVSARAKIKTYNASNYLTTWTSVFFEGAEQGVRDGLASSAGNGASALVELLMRQMNLTEMQSRQRVERMRIPPSEWYRKAAPISPPPDWYCRKYTLEPSTILNRLATVLQKQGYSLRVLDSASGDLVSEFQQREYQSLVRPSDRDSLFFQVRYVAFADPDVVHGTVVRLRREVFIERFDPAGLYTVFSQGISNGHNEVWLLSVIDGL